MTNINKININKILSDKYLAYAISTIVSRSLPDIRDGLKPVHRRIIYSMYQLKLNSDSPYKKCARIVGDVMGKFHPHGDQAIYASLVRLSQDFSTRAPLIDGQGNFGNIDGDNAAAMRYTEARLDPISQYFFDGLEEDAVDLKENYDGQNLEPVVLPTRLPNILLNGSSGIAVGMATNIPPHNIFELNDAIISLIKNPNITLLSLLKNIPGPDLPTGGEISITPEEQKEIYKKGKGSFLIKSKWHIENLKNGTYQIAITEIPFQVNKARLIEQFANLINHKKLPLDDVFDESDENIRIILKPKNRNIDSSKLIELSFKLSDLSIRYSCNFNVLIDGINPKQIGLIEILKNFINFRILTIKRKASFNTNKILKRIEILEGFIIAYKFLDQIIKIIRTKDNPKKEIMNKYKLSINQVEAILSMRLGSLKKIDELSTKNEIKQLKAELSILKKLLNDKKFVNNYLIDEFLNINKDLNNSNYIRKTKVIIGEQNQSEVTLDEFKEIEKLTVILTSDGLLKCFKDHISIDKLRLSNKDIINFYHILSNQKLLIFVSSGKVFTIDPNEIPSGKSNAKNFIYFINANMDDKLVKLIPFALNLKCIVGTKKGKGFIADLNQIITSQKKGKQLVNLKKDDLLIQVITDIKSHIACVNTEKKLLIFKTKDLPTLQKGSGVQLQKIKINESLNDIQIFNIHEGISWKIGNKNKTQKDIKFWIGKRSQSGKKIPKNFNKNLKFHD